MTQYGRRSVHCIEAAIAILRREHMTVVCCHHGRFIVWVGGSGVPLIDCDPLRVAHGWIVVRLFFGRNGLSLGLFMVASLVLRGHSGVVRGCPFRCAATLS